LRLRRGRLEGQGRRRGRGQIRPLGRPRRRIWIGIGAGGSRRRWGRLGRRGRRLLRLLRCRLLGQREGLSLDRRLLRLGSL
jgi:hypothetical protein